MRLCTFDRLNGLVEYSLGGKAAGLIRLGNTPEVVSLFLVDNTGVPVSEATLSQPSVPETTKTLRKDTIKVGETLRYDIPQAAEGTETVVRVAAGNAPLQPMEAELKYISDYQSDLPFPSESYGADSKSLRENLHIWLNSARFKRFNITEALRKGENIYRYMPEDNLAFGGSVTYANGHKLDGGSVLAYNTETNNVYTADIDSQGRFRIAVDDFPEGVDFYIEAKSAKGKSDFFKYEMDNDTFPEARRVMPRQAAAWRNTSTVKTPEGVKPGFNDGRYFSLPCVEVKARVKSPHNIPTQKFYNLNYVDREEIERKDYHSLLDILYQMPGITVVRHYKEAGLGRTDDTPEYSIQTRRGASTLNERPEMLFLLDGSRCDDIDNILQMSAFEIESVGYLLLVPPSRGSRIAHLC